ncbi:MAG: metal ABC transporter permease [Infirmifilum sp.]
MYLDLNWVIVIMSTSLAFSALSPIISARRLNFFASSLPHAALLSIALGYMMSIFLAGDPTLWAVIVSIPLSYLQMYLVHRGVDENTATSVFVAFTTSASVAALYYILTMFPAKVSLWSYILGDPLLASWEDTVNAAVTSIALILLTLAFYEKEVLIGVDRDYAMLNGINAKLHDYFVITLLTVASVGLLRVVGFVIEHVVMLLPAAIAATSARNSREVLLISMLSSAFSGFMGLLLAIYMNIAPSAAFGLILFTLYLIFLVIKGEK